MKHPTEIELRAWLDQTTETSPIAGFMVGLTEDMLFGQFENHPPWLSGQTRDGLGDLRFSALPNGIHLHLDHAKHGMIDYLAPIPATHTEDAA